MAVIITEFQLDEFHGGNPLRVLDLGNGLNVALVRNAVGRNQLLQLSPYVLYGREDFFTAHSPDRMAAGSRGTLKLRSDHGVFRVERTWEPSLDQSAQSAVPVLTGTDGQTYDARFLAADILEGLPSENFREVFTFDLPRLAAYVQSGDQQLVQLADFLVRQSPTPKAAAPIVAPPPNLTGITSRLSELRELVHSGSQISNATHTQNGGQKVRGVRGNREKIRQRLKSLDGEISSARAKWNQLQKENDEIRCVSTMARIQSQLRRVKRQQKEERAPEPSKQFQVNTEAAARLEDKLNSLRAERKELQSEAEELKRQRNELGDLTRTERLVPQIDALLIQEKSLVKEETACEQLEDKIRELETQIETERLRPEPTPVLSSLAPTSLESSAHARLDQLSERLRESQRELEVAEDRYQRAKQATDLAENSRRQATSLTSHPEDVLAIHEAENRIQGLRELLGMQDRLSEMELEREALQVDLQHLYAHQMPPFRTVMALGIPFMVGVAMIIYGLVMTPPETNWRLVILGFLASVVSALIKISMDQGIKDELFAARQNLTRLNYRIEEVGEAQQGTEVSGISVQRQLDEAERDLARLQQRFQSREPEPATVNVVADTNVEASRLQWEHAQQRQLDITGQWRDLMIELGLPPNSMHTDAREALTARTRTTHTTSTASKRPDTSHLDFQLNFLRQDIDRRRDRLANIDAQTRQLISELGFSGTVTGIGEQVDLLREALSEHKEKTQSRRELGRAMKRLKSKMRRVRESGRRVTEQRSKLDEEVRIKQKRAKAESKLRKEKSESLEKERKRLERELADVRTQHNVQSKSSLNELAELSEDELVAHQDDLQRRMDKSQEELLKLSEQRGRYRAELNAIDEHRDEAPQPNVPDVPWHAILEKAQQAFDECELTETTTQSIAPAATQAQYAYLDLASDYLHKLSGGQFASIQPPHDGTLLLTEHSGQTLRLEEVRREHYANIYFSLWLARLEAYADQGLRLPIIMEDPLEATDPQRKPIVATLLRDIAARGHQVVLVTSESFNASIFAQLDVPIADLSDRESIAVSNGHPAGDVITEDESFELAQTKIESDPIRDDDEPLFPPA